MSDKGSSGYHGGGVDTVISVDDVARDAKRLAEAGLSGAHRLRGC